MDMDITYSAKDATFKSLLSLVPGIYTDDFTNIETSGNLSFDGMVKGKYDSLTMPAFNLGLVVSDAMFKYPDLPTAISNISMDLFVDNKDGVIDNTLVNLKQFHMDFGNNPIDAKVLISNLVDYNMDANVKGKLNLAELSTMFPMEGTSMKGLYVVDVSAKGTYDSVSGRTPVIAAKMNLTDGYVKSADLPYALENLKFAADINSPSGLMADFKAVVKDFGMTMDGEPFKADLTFSNLDNYTWDLSAEGGIDLEKITKIFPLEGMTLTGLIKANLSTAGNMADLDAERYANLPTSGKATINNFSYVDAELPYKVTISNAVASFDPQKITLEKYVGTIGNSDMNMTGGISNYIGYLFGENQILKGTLNFNSTKLDLNEFMAEEEGAVETPAAAEVPMTVIEVPKDIDFVLTSNIQTVVVMDMTITNAKGDIVVRDGVINLSGINFNLLEGAFGVSGLYDPRDLEKPKYDFKLKVDNLSSQKAFETFTIIQSYFPIAKNVNGKLSTDFSIKGLLDQEMMPDMATVSGAGMVKIAEAKLLNSKLLKGIGSTAGIKSLSSDEVNIKDMLMNVTIEDGKVNIEPFDMNLGGYKATVSGSSLLDGGLDYGLKMDVPAGKLGSAVNDLKAKYSGGGTASDNTVIPLNFGIGGTYDDPTYKLKGSDTKIKATDVVKAVAKDQVEKKLGVDLDTEKEKQRTNILANAQKNADNIVAEGKQAADKVRQEGNAQADNLIKEAGSNFLKKKVAEEAAKKLRSETEAKAVKIEAESKAKANDLMAKAKEQAAAL
jgi:hypothetical protein